MSQAKLQEDPVAYWNSRIQQEKKAHEKFRKQAKDSQQAARDDSNKKHTYNIHWSNCRITAAAIYAKSPKADVRRRFQKPDPEEKELARGVERAIDYSIDVGRFDTASRAVVRDFVRSGIGVPRVVYDAKTQPMQLSPEALQVVQAMGEEVPEEVVDQSVDIEHVPWSCFGWEPGHSEWKNVGWVYFKTYNSAKGVKQEYGVKIEGTEEGDQDREARKYGNEVVIYEIWHKPSRKVFVISPSHDEPLDVYDDPLGLQGFYPCPRPMFDNLKSDELIPKPDYCFIESQIQELQRIAQERKALAAKIRPVRLCDAKDSQQVQDVLDTPGGGVVPVSSLVERMSEAGGALMVPVPNDDQIKGLEVLDRQLENVKQQVYEILGISDIVRGASQASETATAQQIKSNWANVRLNEKQSEVNRCWRETLRIMAEIVCEQFLPEQFALMTGVQLTPRMMEMMKSDIGRNYAIDVETDSTVLTDDQEERQAKLELVNTILERMQITLPMVQGGQMPVEMMQELLLFSVSQYKNSKQLEDAIMSLAPHLAQMTNFQAQMQQLQQQLQQEQMNGQQLGAQLQQAQGQLAQVNERKEAREDAKVQADIQKKGADTQIAVLDKQAESGLDKAKTEEIYQRIGQGQLVQTVGLQ